MSFEVTHHHPIMDAFTKNDQVVALLLTIECTCCHLAVLASRPELSAWRLVLLQQARLQLANVSIFLLLGCLIVLGFGHLHAMSWNALPSRARCQQIGLLLHRSDQIATTANRLQVIARYTSYDSCIVHMAPDCMPLHLTPFRVTQGYANAIMLRAPAKPQGCFAD